jgi:hypothetical protein
MAQDVKFVILVTENAKLLLGHWKCGEWPYLFATIVANTKIMLDIAELEQELEGVLEGYAIKELKELI